MKKFIASVALMAMAGLANATNTTNLFPNGDFESGGAGAWVEAFGGAVTYNYPASGGNPNGYGVMDSTGNPAFAIWVGGAATPLSLSSLGLTAGQSYTFVQDMKITSGVNIGGLKVESWGPSGVLDNSGDMRPSTSGHNTAAWETYSFTYTVNPAATGLKIVPLWGPGSVVGYDNLGVVVVGATPLSVSITSPTIGQVVYSNFTINATAAVVPGTVTNVNFYVDAALIGNDPSSPFSFNAVGVSAGAHALKAIARDSSGNFATSSVVNITVTNVAPPAFSAYEKFNYALGSFPNNTAATGTGFTGTWTCGAAGTTVAGLTWPALPTANNALQSGASRQFASFASTLSSGTRYVSFLTKGSGNPGANACGVYLKGDNATSLFAGFRSPFSANLTGWGLGSVTSAGSAATGITGLGSAVNITNTDTHFMVLKIDFNTSGANDTVSLWIDPPAGTNDPGVAANLTYSAYDVGSISAFGLNVQGGMNLTVDEIRGGTTYGDVAGSSVSATIPTTLALSVAASKQISWTASSTNYYQPQSSTDGVNWNDLGSLISGNSVTSVSDPAPVAFYQVLEIAPVTTDQIANGDFEISDGAGGAQSWNGVGSMPPTQSLADFHGGAASMMIYVTNATITAQNSEMQQNVLNAGSPGITEGNTYDFSFWAKALPKFASGGYVHNYKVTWLGVGSVVVGAIGFTPFTANTSTWTKTDTGPVVAPAGAVNALIQIFGASGGIAGDFGGVLIDDVSMTGTTATGSINTLSPSVQNGAVFTATVRTNGVTAVGASGNVQFKTNTVNQSLTFVTGGVAVSASAVVPASYTVTAIYSGDSTYLGSTATLVVGGPGNTPTNITARVSGNLLTLSWPASHLGWFLQSQTNSLSAGLRTNWVIVAGSETSTQAVITINRANPSVFFRLRSP